jgi:hypothetical protein
MEHNPLPNRVANEIRELREQQDRQWWRDEKNRDIRDDETFVHPNEIRIMKQIGKTKSKSNSAPLDPVLATIIVITIATIYGICTIIF